MPLLSHAVLTDPELVVPAVPDSPPGGVAWLRSSVARFSGGAAHRRRCALTVADLASVDAGGGDGPVEVLASTVAGRTGPPVPLTGRVAPDGALVEVGLAEVPFGIGPHARPGREHAPALAAGLAEARTR
ncbi:hypothetical protein ACIBL5_22525 [Streptomyces sp. NPDC050516]|uniref:hypothetical protein n=1 Tax=Streptomyces sp. NPDC050516 TaxID=3365621 RepID=UPI0037A1A29B